MKRVKVIRRGQLRHVERLSMFYRSAQGNTCTRENWVLEFLPLPRLQSNFSNSEAGNHTNLTSVCQFTWAERFAPSPSSTATLNAKLHKEDHKHEYKKSIFEEGRIFSKQQIQNRTERTMQRRKMCIFISSITEFTLLLVLSPVVLLVFVSNMKRRDQRFECVELLCLLGGSACLHPQQALSCSC